MENSFITFDAVTKTYDTGETPVRALDAASFAIERGELAVIVGASGAGKTTALNILGGMDRATSGQVIVDGRDITALSDRELITYRRHDIGFVFQFYNLVPNLTALENVELATQISDHAQDPKMVLTKVGLTDRMNNFPAQLSGGEQQRVAIARAIAKNPQLLLCDEPTGALDYQTGRQILKLLSDTCRHSGITVVIITHNLALCPMGDRVITFQSGRVISEKTNPAPMPVESIEW